jgi:hypothetical protein
VPREAGACAAFDSVSFLHPSLDVSIDFDCYASSCQESPRQAAERDQELLNQLLGVKLTEPAFVRREDPDGGAERRADLTFDVVHEGVARTTRFLRSYRLSPPFLFTFVARAESRAFLRYADEAMSIVDSLAVDDGGPRADRAGRIAKSHMAQGRVDGEFVKDDGLGIAVKGPCGWSPSPQPGVGRFCVRFSPPAGDAPLEDVKIEGPPKEGETLTPAGPRPETSWTIFAWEDALSPFGEGEVVRFFEGRRASMLDCEYQEWSVLRRESSDHPNGVDIVYEVESRWRQQSCTAPGEPIEMREVFSAVPVGRFLLCAVARAPKDEFERRRREFERALGTLTHDLRR